MNIFNGIMAKVAAAFAVVAGVFFTIMRYQSRKIKGLKRENKTLNKKNEIKTQATIDTKKVISNEQKAIDEVKKEVKENDKKIGVDNINKL